MKMQFMESECCVVVSQVLLSPVLGSAPGGFGPWGVRRPHLLLLLGPPRPGRLSSCQTSPEEGLQAGLPEAYTEGNHLPKSQVW
jgi:hypothetical protein